MPAASFFCGAWSAFRPAVEKTSDPAVLEVTGAIYFCGRTDGQRGMDSMAHVIQNRMNNAAYPNDAIGVISADRDQFPQTPRQPMPTTQGHAEKLLFDRATSLAEQLIHGSPPHRLRSTDPTGGKLHSNLRGSGNVSASVGESNKKGSAPHDDELSDEGDMSPPPASPRPVLPTRSRSFLASDQSVAGVNIVRRPYVDGGKDSTVATTCAASASSKSSSRPTTPPGMPPSNHAGDQPVRSVTPPPIAPPVSSTPNPISSLIVNHTPPTTPSSRLMRLGRSRSSGLALQGTRLGPADENGYHDMRLECGLYQEDVIAMMYSDLTPLDYEKLCKLDEAVPKRNISKKNLVDQLPRCAAKDCGATECRVCLTSFESHESTVKLPCSHAFHHKCISQWLTEGKNACPLCSAAVTPETSASCGTSLATASTTRSAMRAL
jgi:hypothetical protein